MEINEALGEFSRTGNRLPGKGNGKAIFEPSPGTAPVRRARPDGRGSISSESLRRRHARSLERIFLPAPKVPFQLILPNTLTDKDLEGFHCRTIFTLRYRWTDHRGQVGWNAYRVLLKQTGCR